MLQIDIKYLFIISEGFALVIDKRNFVNSNMKATNMKHYLSAHTVIEQ